MHDEKPLPHAMSSHRRFGAALCCVLVLACPSSAHAALCGDSSGDGFVSASDALATLRLAVTSGYDRRGDVMPRPSTVTNEGGDGDITAVDALETLRAAVEARIPACHGATATRAVVSTAAIDFSSAGLAVVDTATRTFEYRAGAVWRDSVIRAPNGIPIVINRNGFPYGNTLKFFDIEDDDLPTIKECSISDDFDSNPQDVLLLSGEKGYVTPYAGAELFVISPPVLFQPELDPACHGIIVDRIDLSVFDSDGVPQMDQMLAVGDDLFVSLQLLDDEAGGLPPKEHGVLAVIDTTTDALKGSIPLSFENPFGETKGLVWDEFQQRIFVGGPGTIGDVLDDGGIEAIDPIAMQSTGMVMTGADIDANIFDYVIVGSARAYAIIADNDSNSVVELAISTDPSKRKLVEVLLSSTSLITDIEMTETGELWVAYRGETKNDPSGLRIFDVTDNHELTVTDDDPPQPKPISLGQAPFTLAFIE